MKSGAILVLESVTKKLVSYKAMNEEQQLSMGDVTGKTCNDAGNGTEAIRTGYS